MGHQEDPAQAAPCREAPAQEHLEDHGRVAPSLEDRQVDPGLEDRQAALCQAGRPVGHGRVGLVREARGREDPAQADHGREHQVGRDRAGHLAVHDLEDHLGGRALEVHALEVRALEVRDRGLQRNASRSSKA